MARLRWNGNIKAQQDSETARQSARPSTTRRKRSKTPKPISADSATRAGREYVAHKAPGEPCWKCGTLLVKKTPKHHGPKPGQSYYYDWYLSCPGCSTMFLVESAKRDCASQQASTPLFTGVG